MSGYRIASGVDHVAKDPRSYSLDLKSGKRTQLTRDPTGHSNGFISPDGKSIVYLKDQKGSEVGALVRVPFGGGVEEPLTTDLPPYSVDGVTFDRAGRFLVFAMSDASGYRFFRWQAGQRKLLFESKNEAYSPLLSADGRYVAFHETERKNNRHFATLVVDAASGPGAASRGIRKETGRAEKGFLHPLVRRRPRLTFGHGANPRRKAGPRLLRRRRGHGEASSSRKACRSPALRSDTLAPVIADFHLIALPLGSEEWMLERALQALDEVDAGETAFLPEYVAWTPRGSGRAFARLIALAQARNINIVTTLNVGRDLHEDLPGRDPEARYNALVIFTRHGTVHVPQAKVTPQSFEMDDAPQGPGIGVEPYERINRVRLDWQDALVDARFLICSDVAAFLQFSPQDLQCDLLVVLGNFAYGAERAASRLLGHAIAAGAAGTTFHVNAFHVPAQLGQPALALKVEEVLDATSQVKAAARWPSPRALRGAFHVYEDEDARDFRSMCNLPRRGRIAVPRSRWKPALQLGEYPVTVAL